MTTDKKQQLLKLLEDEPNDSFLKYALGLEYAKEEKYEPALSYFEDILKNQPDYLPVYYQAAQIYAIAEQNEQAEKCYRQGIQVAQSQQNRHILAELQNAYQNWLYELDE